MFRFCFGEEEFQGGITFIIIITFFTVCIYLFIIIILHHMHSTLHL